LIAPPEIPAVIIIAMKRDMGALEGRTDMGALEVRIELEGGRRRR